MLLAILFSLSQTVQAAEYLGRDVDGEIFSATVFSYRTGKFYNADVIFFEDEAEIILSRGGRIILILDDEEIDDPHSISAFDYKHVLIGKLI